MPESRKVIWKFAIQPGRFSLDMTESATVISVGLQENGPQLWAEIYPDFPKVKRYFVAVPTGGEVPQRANYIGTVLGIDGWMVFHIYALAEAEKVSQ